MYCASCGKEFFYVDVCPQCGRIVESAVVTLDPPPQDFVEVNASPVFQMPAQSETAVHRKRRNIILIGIVSDTVLIIAAMIIAAVIFMMPKNKTLGVTPEIIEEWYKNCRDDISGAEIVCVTWELDSDSKPEYVYTPTADKDICKFNVYSTGFQMLGLADSETHEIMDVFISVETAEIFEILYEDEYSASTIEAAVQETDLQILTVFVMNLFDITESEARELVKDSSYPILYEYNGTEYCIEGYTYDTDLTLTITTHGDLEGMLEYMEALTELGGDSPVPASIVTR